MAATLILLFAFPFFLCLFGLFGNLLVLISICIERRLQNTTNYFLFSLALADLFVCLLVMPFSLLAELSIGFEWTFAFCLCYLYADVFLCTASIVHMTVISLDRYLGISQPLKSRNRQKRTVALKIAFVWLMTILISSPLAILSFVNTTNILIENDGCSIRSRSFMLYGSTFSFLIPVIVLTVTTSRTTNLLNKQAKLLNNKQHANHMRRTVMPARKKFGRIDSNNLSTGSCGSRSLSGAKCALVEKANNGPAGPASAAGGVRLSLSTGPPSRKGKFQRQMTAPAERRKFSLPQIDAAAKADEATANAANYDAMSTIGNSTNANFGKKGKSSPALILNRLIGEKLKASSSPATTTIAAENCSSALPSMLYANNNNNSGHGGHSMLKKKTSSNTKKLVSEQKATRVLIVQIVCFYFCWTPFFVQNIILGVCGQKCELLFPQWFALCAVWVGYFSSVINPIIYTIFNRRFREAFIRIIQCEHSFRRESGSMKFWPTLTEAQGLNTTLNSLCQKFSKRIEFPSVLGTNAATRGRRSSYAGGEIGTRRKNSEPTFSANNKKSLRRSTLMVPFECSSSSETFVTRRSLGIPPLFVQQYNKYRAAFQPGLYTISDSEEEADGESQLSESADASRKHSMFGEFRHLVATKVPWQRIGRSASNLFHHHASDNNGREGREGAMRKITPHILFPLQDVHITLGCTERKSFASASACCYEGVMDAQEMDFIEEGESFNSSSMSTVEEFFAQKMGQFKSNQTCV